MDNVVHTFVVPTPAGVANTVAAPPDTRGTIVLGLLQGGASRPVPLERLAELAELPDRKAAGSILFQLQRLSWLSGELEPFAPPVEPLRQSLPALIALLSPLARGILADAQGLCIASTGYPEGMAHRLSALAAKTFPLIHEFRETGEESASTPAAMTLEGLDPDCAVSVRPLYVGRHLFHLLLAGRANPDSPAFVHLIAVLARRYLGEV
jgi:hypothetical protein